MGELRESWAMSASAVSSVGALHSRRCRYVHGDISFRRCELRSAVILAAQGAGEIAVAGAWQQ